MTTARSLFERARDTRRIIMNDDEKKPILTQPLPFLHCPNRLVFNRSLDDHDLPDVLQKEFIFAPLKL